MIDASNQNSKVSSFNKKKIIQIESSFYHSCALTGKHHFKNEIYSKDDGFVYSWGRNNDGQLGHGDTEDRNSPTLIDGLSKIKKIYCGGFYSMAINGNKMNF